MERAPGPGPDAPEAPYEPPALSQNPIMQMLSQWLFSGNGLPHPQVILTEIHRLNNTLEQIVPLVGVLQEAIPDIQAAIKGLTADDIRNLTEALRGATLMGEKFRSGFTV